MLTVNKVNTRIDKGESKGLRDSTIQRFTT